MFKIPQIIKCVISSAFCAIIDALIFQETENLKLCFLDPLSQKNCSLKISK